MPCSVLGKHQQFDRPWPSVLRQAPLLSVLNSEVASTSGTKSALLWDVTLRRNLKRAKTSFTVLQKPEIRHKCWCWYPSTELNGVTLVKLNQAVKLLMCICYNSASNTYRDDNYPDFFRGFPQYLQQAVGLRFNAFEDRFLPHPPLTSIHRHHLSVQSAEQHHVTSSCSLV